MEKLLRIKKMSYKIIGKYIKLASRKTHIKKDLIFEDIANDSDPTE